MFLPLISNQSIKMVKIYTAIFIILGTFTITAAQITLNNSHLPVIGDTLKMATDEIPTNISLGDSGPDQIWQFSNLQAPFSQNYTVERLSTEEAQEAFPDADYLIRFSETLIGFYKVEGNYLRYLGTQGVDPLQFGLNINARIDNNGLIERKIPLQYGDTYESEGTMDLPFASNDLPDAILEQLPIRPDSFRILSTINRSSTIDGWGTLLTEAGNFKVLRENRTETTTITLEAKFSFLPWQDITELLPENELLGERVIKSFHFLSDSAKEPIAVVYTNADESKIERVEFKSGDILTSTPTIKTSRPNVLAFPNPAIISVRFQFSNIPAGNYQLKVFSLLGKELWGKSYYINGNRTEKVDITYLQKGAYFYSLINESGKTLMTRKLIVLRP